MLSISKHKALKIFECPSPILYPSSLSLFSPCTDGLERRSIPHEDGTFHSNIKPVRFSSEQTTTEKHVSGAQPFCLTCSSYTIALLPASEWTASRIDMELYLRDRTGEAFSNIFKYVQDSSRFEWFGIWHDLYDLASVAPAPWLSRYFSTSSCRKVTVAELHYHSRPFRWPSTKR